MSRKYKFHNEEGLYFVSFATVYWIDVFVREVYFDIVFNGLKYCEQNKGMEIYAWCIMPSHVHLIFRAKDNNPSDVLRDFKRVSSKRLLNAIEENPTESRKEWMLWMMKKAGTKNSNVSHRQFWQQHNKPIELWSSYVIQQKVDYIHNNPVEAGFVTNAVDWKYSSAANFNNSLAEIKL
jgi:putative transposase